MRPERVVGFFDGDFPEKLFLTGFFFFDFLASVITQLSRFVGNEFL